MSFETALSLRRTSSVPDNMYLQAPDEFYEASDELPETPMLTASAPDIQRVVQKAQNPSELQADRLRVWKQKTNDLAIRGLDLGKTVVQGTKNVLFAGPLGPLNWGINALALGAYHKVRDQAKSDIEQHAPGVAGLVDMTDETTVKASLAKVTSVLAAGAIQGALQAAMVEEQDPQAPVSVAKVAASVGGGVVFGAANSAHRFVHDKAPGVAEALHRRGQSPEEFSLSGVSASIASGLMRGATQSAKEFIQQEAPAVTGLLPDSWRPSGLSAASLQEAPAPRQPFQQALKFILSLATGIQDESPKNIVLDLFVSGLKKTQAFIDSLPQPDNIQPDAHAENFLQLLQQALIEYKERGETEGLQELLKMNVDAGKLGDLNMLRFVFNKQPAKALPDIGATISQAEAVFHPEMQEPLPEEDVAIIRATFNSNVDAFASNCTHFATMRFLAEVLFRKKVESSKCYSSLLSQPSREAMVEQFIIQMKLPFPTAVKILFSCIDAILHPIFQAIFNNIRATCDSFIQRKEQLPSTMADIIVFCTSYCLSYNNGAKDYLEAKPRPKTQLDEFFLNSEIKTSEKDLLWAKLHKLLINRLLPEQPLLIFITPWHEKMLQSITYQWLWDNGFKYFFKPLNFLLTPVHFVTSKILKWGVLKFLNRSQMLKGVAEDGINSLNNTDTVMSLNKIILNILDVLHSKIVKSKNKSSPQASLANETWVSETVRMQLKSLSSELFDFLKLAGQQTPSQVEAALNSFKSKAQDALERYGMQEALIDAMASIGAVGFTVMMQENMLYHWVNLFFVLGNQSFAENQPISPAEATQTSDQIMNRIQAITAEAVKDALDQFFTDRIPLKQDLIDKSYKELGALITGYVEETARELKTIITISEKGSVLQDPDLGELEMLQKLPSPITLAINYTQQIFEKVKTFSVQLTRHPDFISATDGVKKELLDGLNLFIAHTPSDFTDFDKFKDLIEDLILHVKTRIASKNLNQHLLTLQTAEEQANIEQVLQSAQAIQQETKEIQPHHKTTLHDQHFVKLSSDLTQNIQQAIATRQAADQLQTKLITPYTEILQNHRRKTELETQIATLKTLVPSIDQANGKLQEMVHQYLRTAANESETAILDDYNYLLDVDREVNVFLEGRSVSPQATLLTVVQEAKNRLTHFTAQEQTSFTNLLDNLASKLNGVVVPNTLANKVKGLLVKDNCQNIPDCVVNGLANLLSQVTKRKQSESYHLKTQIQRSIAALKTECLKNRSSLLPDFSAQLKAADPTEAVLTQMGLSFDHLNNEAIKKLTTQRRELIEQLLGEAQELSKLLHSQYQSQQPRFFTQIQKIEQRLPVLKATVKKLAENKNIFLRGFHVGQVMKTLLSPFIQPSVERYLRQGVMAARERHHFKAIVYRLVNAATKTQV